MKGVGEVEDRRAEVSRIWSTFYSEIATVNIEIREEDLFALIAGESVKTTFPLIQNQHIGIRIMRKPK